MRQVISRSSAGFLSIVFFCASCGQSGSGSRLTPANYDQVTIGMNKKRVEEILGSPTRVETKQALVFAGSESKWEPVTTYRYENGQTFVAITFKNDQVDKKDSNLGREP
jgi:outer membrane protein assembly factor BamE (lipoprotein component of BamABCDE complex)